MPRISRFTALSVCWYLHRVLVFHTEVDTPRARHNLLRRQLQPACKRLRLSGITWKQTHLFCFVSSRKNRAALL